MFKLYTYFNSFLHFKPIEFPNAAAKTFKYYCYYIPQVWLEDAFRSTFMMV